jgi:chemosensory pili system protein ChpA (sensor histidine kinase/response regulator)
MPQMDGYALAQAIRADAGLAGLPIVAISSRAADRHRDHALALGMDHYLGKPYAEEELLSLLRRYAAPQQAGV